MPLIKGEPALSIASTRGQSRLKGSLTSRASFGSITSWSNFRVYVEFHNFCFLIQH